VVFGNWRWYWETGIQKLAVVFGNWKVLFGSWTVVFGNSKVVFRNWYSETRNPVFGNWELYSKLESDIRKLGIVFENYYSESETLKLGNCRDTTTEH
jgi:hypothetical protein